MTNSTTTTIETTINDWTLGKLEELHTSDLCAKNDTIGEDGWTLGNSEGFNFNAQY